MSYFTQDFLDFYIELAGNNHRDWFHANKKRYEKSVKEPFLAFIADFIARAQADDNTIQMRPQQAVFRINRDVRFSQDKSPYKLFSSGIIKPGAHRDMEIPGIYFEFGPEHLAVYGGSYQPSKTGLESIRRAIVTEPLALTNLLNAEAFKSHYGDLKGEQNVRLVKDFQAVREVQPLIANKQFYYTVEHPAEMVLREDLLDFMMGHYFAGKPVNRWLQQAMVFN